MSRPHYEPSVTLHQQDGGLSLQAFSELHGILPRRLVSLIKRGLVLGAQKDARSKKWMIYPPAKLLERPRSRNRSAASIDAADCAGRQASADSPDLLACGSADTGEAGTDSRQSGQYAPHVKAEGIHPPASLQAPQGRAEGLTLEAAALPGAARSLRARQPASSGKPEVYTEARSVCRMLSEAAARQFREGLHYLRLDAHEFAQLYAALNSDRSRVRKLVGRGLLPVGLLRASDSVWQKMQAMSREGRLL